VKRVTIGCLAACVFAAACILNPQPFPPESGSADGGASAPEAVDSGVDTTTHTNADGATDAGSDTSVGPASSADAGPDDAAEADSPIDAASADGDTVDDSSDVLSD
jgi:hypothetical protein